MARSLIDARKVAMPPRFEVKAPLAEMLRLNG
jgi:hypothetical protein